MKQHFADIADAIAACVPFDRLVLFLPGRCLERGMRPPAPMATSIIPLFAGGSLVGRLHVTRGGDAFTQEERRMLAYLSPHLAMSVQSLAEVEARGRLLAEAEALLEIGRATAALLDPAEVVSRGLDVVSRYLPPATQFAVFGDHQEADDWICLGARSPDAEKLAALQALRLRSRDIGAERERAIRAGDSYFVANVQDESGLFSELARKFGVRSLLAVPLRSGEQTLGVVCVCNAEADRAFSHPERMLIRGVADQVSISLRNARLARENLRAVEDLRALSRRLWMVQEEERERIARELHDEAGQQMTALKLILDLARREQDFDRVRGRLGEAVELAGAVLDELRRISQDLRPGALHELGLVPALRALVVGFGARTGVGVEFEATAEVVPHPDSDAASTAFRFVQEALTNVARHAQARSVRVLLETTESGRLRVTVQDDGIGFGTESALEGHLGLLGMRERARVLGGRLSLESAAGKGALLSLEIPES